MAERDPHHSVAPPDAVAEFFNVTPRSVSDRKFGHDVKLSLAGVETPGTVELFGESAVVRLTTPNLELTLRNMDRIEVSPDEVVFSWAADDGSGYDAAIARSGEIRLLAPGVSSKLEDPARDQSDVLKERTNGDGAEKSRLTFLGRVGANVAFRTTAKGVLVARFPLAVQRDDGATTWETVVAFGHRAETLRDSVQRGDSIEIVGYAHAREVERRGGSSRSVREIYAAVVKPR